VQAAYWAELLLIQLVAPRASFVGHLAGILAGLLLMRAWNPVAGGPMGGSFGGSVQSWPVPAPATSGRRQVAHPHVALPCKCTRQLTQRCTGQLTNECTSSHGSRCFPSKRLSLLLQSKATGPTPRLFSFKWRHT